MLRKVARARRPEFANGPAADAGPGDAIDPDSRASAAAPAGALTGGLGANSGGLLRRPAVMLWHVVWPGRAAVPASTGASAAEMAVPGEALVPDSGDTPTTGTDATEGGGRPRRWVTKRRIALVVMAVVLGGMGFAYQHKAAFTAQGADLSRRLIGDERTARIESWYFRVQDRVDRLKYRVAGGKTNPFDQGGVFVEFVPKAEAREYDIDLRKHADEEFDLTVSIVIPPKPIDLPQVRQLRDNPESGEGAWTTAGLPRTSPDDIVMAKTFLRPDKARPYALVGVVVVDGRRVRLNMVGGTADPGGDRGVKGPGVIPVDQHASLLLAWNGGFKGPHGNYGMVANGKEYRPLRKGLATIATYGDGTVRMGEWGADIGPDENMVAARQNAVLLVKDGEVSKRVSEGNDTWGYVNVNSAEFITWRSAVGLTKDGNLIYAAGNSLSAATLAQALWAAGAYTAMQLDINTPYVLMGSFFPQTDGTVKALKFMDSMPDTPARFLRTQERDFMYLTVDEARFR